MHLMLSAAEVSTSAEATGKCSTEEERGSRRDKRGG